MALTSLTLSWISPRIFMRWCNVVRELESRGISGGVGLLPRLGDITAASENMKNSDRSEMYWFTTSSAIVRHWVGLRRDMDETFWEKLSRLVLRFKSHPLPS